MDPMDQPEDRWNPGEAGYKINRDFMYNKSSPRLVQPISAEGECATSGKTRLRLRSSSIKQTASSWKFLRSCRWRYRKLAVNTGPCQRERTSWHNEKHLGKWKSHDNDEGPKQRVLVPGRIQTNFLWCERKKYGQTWVHLRIGLNNWKF